MVEKKTDYWVYDMLKESKIELEPKTSSIEEVNTALKTATKKTTKDNQGFPEFIGVVEDFVIVIEDKKNTEYHCKKINNTISIKKSDVQQYAVNGAYYYGKHIIDNTNFNKVFCIGVSGNKKNHKISPIFYDGTNPYHELPNIESFISFNEKNINEYFIKDVLKVQTNSEKESVEIIKDAEELHDYLSGYGGLNSNEKPLIVAGILLALSERDKGNFDIDNLNNDNIETDGCKIYKSIKTCLKRSITSETKRQKIIHLFSLFIDSKQLNTYHHKLGKTPLKRFVEFLDEKIYKSIKYTHNSEDVIGKFYNEFMRYGSGDGQNLGIILTPRHITELFCELAHLNIHDRVIDPCCGTGGFLIAAMHYFLSLASSEQDVYKIKKSNLHGIEIRNDMFTLATTNMILRNDGQSNLRNEDFLSRPSEVWQTIGATVGMINPPYSIGSKEKPELFEMSFVEKMLDSLSLSNSRGLALIPESCLNGTSGFRVELKQGILNKHTLESVITLNKDTFYNIGTNPCIAIFTAHQPHPKDKEVRFINFQDDGFVVKKHIGLVKTESAIDKKEHLLNVYNNIIDAPSDFCVKTTIKATDEWLHSAFYFNDKIPTKLEFEKAVNQYLSFEFSQILNNQTYLSNRKWAKELPEKKYDICELDKIEWKEIEPFNNFDKEHFLIIKHTSTGVDAINLIDGNPCVIPYISRIKTNNGVGRFVSKLNIKKYGYDKGHCITVGLDTQTAFWQPNDFITGQNVHIINGEKLNFFTGLFLIPLLKIQMDAKFNWGGNGATMGRMKRLKLLLPTDSNNNINFDYMEKYIKNLLIDKRMKYYNFIT